MNMKPVHMSRRDLRACLRARRTTFKPDAVSRHYPSLAAAARAALVELDNRLRCELAHGARSRR